MSSGARAASPAPGPRDAIAGVFDVSGPLHGPYSPSGRLLLLRLTAPLAGTSDDVVAMWQDAAAPAAIEVPLLREPGQLARRDALPAGPALRSASQLGLLRAVAEAVYGPVRVPEPAIFPPLDEASGGAVPLIAASGTSVATQGAFAVFPLRHELLVSTAPVPLVIALAAVRKFELQASADRRAPAEATAHRLVLECGEPPRHLAATATTAAYRALELYRTRRFGRILARSLSDEASAGSGGGAGARGDDSAAALQLIGPGLFSPLGPGSLLLQRAPCMTGTGGEVAGGRGASCGPRRAVDTAPQPRPRALPPCELCEEYIAAGTCGGACRKSVCAYCCGLSRDAGRGFIVCIECSRAAHSTCEVCGMGATPAKPVFRCSGCDWPLHDRTSCAGASRSLRDGLVFMCGTCHPPAAGSVLSDPNRRLDNLVAWAGAGLLHRGCQRQGCSFRWRFCTLDYMVSCDDCGAPMHLGCKGDRKSVV